MDLQISVESPRSSDVRPLLEAHLAFTSGETPAEHVYAIGADSLIDPLITFFAARHEGAVVGIAALRELRPRHGEMKSMHTSATLRGRGVGRALVEHIVDVA